MKESPCVAFHCLGAKNMQINGAKNMQINGGFCVGGVSGMDDKFKRKQQMKGSFSGVGVNGVSGINADFQRLNLGIEGSCDPNIHPLLRRVGWRVMIIDDPHPKSRFNVFTRLHLLFFYSGCEVHASTGPSSTLSLLKQRKNMVDFVICNIHMKGMDEATLFELVGLKDMPVIMMSTYMDTRLVTEGMNHGACSFILKPQSWDDVQNISSFMLKRKKYPSKLPRILYKKFDEVVDQLGGLDEAAPEKILELMDGENIIPLEVIADHLEGSRELAKLIPCNGTRKERQDAKADRFNVGSQT